MLDALFTMPELSYYSKLYPVVRAIPTVDPGPRFEQIITLVESSDDVKGEQGGLNWLKAIHKEIQALASDFTPKQQANQHSNEDMSIY